MQEVLIHIRIVLTRDILHRRSRNKVSSSQLEDEADLVSIFQVAKPLAGGLSTCCPRCVIE